mgnify:CR=1 FL=1
MVMPLLPADSNKFANPVDPVLTAAKLGKPG